MKSATLRHFFGPALIGIALTTGASAQVLVLNGTVRDFSIAPGKLNPDFENYIDGGLVTGIVNPTIIPGGKPVFSGGTFASVNGASSFNQWFNNTPSVNISFARSITLNDDGVLGDLVDNDGLFTFSSSEFFPIDGVGFGNQEGQAHNFGFTYEIHTTFGYDSSRPQTFTFSGDDDVFVFVNGKQIIDLGGVHEELAQTANLNLLAPSLGLVSGNNYALDFFFAERHTFKSEFTITTELDTSGNISNPVPEPSTYGLIGAAVLCAGAVFRRRRRARA